MNKKRNIFTYMADFFRSIGDSMKTLVETSPEDKKEGLEAFKTDDLSQEDEKLLDTLIESQEKVGRMAEEHEKLIASIDYPDKGKDFKTGVKAEELGAEEEIESPEKPASRVIEEDERGN